MDCLDILSFVATLFLLYRDIISLCRDKDWLSLFEVAGNSIATYFLRHDIILPELNELCRDIILLCRDISSKNPRLMEWHNNYFYVTT